MNKQWVRLALVVGALALGAAACGSDESDTTTDPSPAELPPVGDELPPNDEASDDPSPAAACLVGEPECDDTGAMGEEPNELPEPEPVDDGAIIDGGISVPEALATSAAADLAVEGHLFDDGTGVRLCESLEPAGERYRCGGDSLAIENYDEEYVGAPIVFHEGVTYTEETLTLFGDLADGVLTLELTG